MWSVSDIRNRGKKNFRKNYWKSVFVCILILVFGGGYRYNYSLLNVLGQSDTSVNAIDRIGDTAIANNLLDYIGGIFNNYLPIDGIELWNTIRSFDPAKALLSSFFHMVSDSNAAVIGAFNLSHLMSGGSGLNLLLISMVGVTVFILIQVFFCNILIIGEKRFYLENAKYHQTDIQTILMPYIVVNGYRSGFSYFVKSLYQFLWNLTIVGGIIKHYSYLMVPYILAENPLMKANEAISLSRKMMAGSKWQAFKLELTFIWLKVLNVFTLGLLAVLFMNPYMTATFAELYLELRDSESGDFIDDSLAGSKWLSNYDLDNYPLPLHENRPVHLEDYNIHYPLVNLLLLYMFFSIIGWIWEVNYYLMQSGVFVNRGTMHGPWLPLYGNGALVVLFLVKRFSRNIGLTFLMCMVITGIMEYGTGTLLWLVKGMKWWDYSGYILNLHGRICLEGLIIFAIMGIMAVYILAPFINRTLEKTDLRKRKVIAAVLIAIFLTDFIYSFINPNVGTGITSFYMMFH